VLQGTVFTLKTSPEVSKSRVFRLSTETLNEMRSWFQALENVEGVVRGVKPFKGGREGRGAECPGWWGLGVVSVLLPSLIGDGSDNKAPLPSLPCPQPSPPLHLCFAHRLPAFPDPIPCPIIAARCLGKRQRRSSLARIRLLKPVAWRRATGCCSNAASALAHIFFLTILRRAASGQLASRAVHTSSTRLRGC